LNNLSYIAPRAYALDQKLISRPAETRVDVLASSRAERLAYIAIQWPDAEIEVVKGVLYNMWMKASQFLGLEAIFSPPDCCTGDQREYHAKIRPSLPTLFLCAMEAYINLGFRFRQNRT
jgi:hypothetical protein